MHKIKISIIKLFIFIIVLAAIPLATAHNLPGVYKAALFGAQNSNYSQFDNINLIISGIIHFNDYIFLITIALGFLVYFFGIQELHKKGMYSIRSNLFFILVFVFITIYSIVFMIHQVSAATLDNPLGGEAFVAGDTIAINWTLGGAAHIDLHYTTTGITCPANNGGNSCAAESGFNCILHPQTGTSRLWTTPNINSSKVRIRVEPHDGSHIASGSENCSGNFTIATIPSVRTNFSATAINDSAINLTWDTQFDYELVEKYLIFRDGINTANTTDNDTNSHLDTGLNASTTYDYSLKAFNPVGESGFSSNSTNSTTGNVPVVTLTSPSDLSSNNSNSVFFNCSATDDVGLANLTLYGNWSGGWHANETINVTGLSNLTNFTKTLINNDTYIWNCLAGDDSGNNNFSVNNFTFTLDNGTAPSTVTSLAETSTGEFSIDWNWTNPPETDFNYTEIYRDGTFIVNVFSPTSNYTMEGLAASTTYNIGTRTVDNAGNINTTFVNDSATTQASSNGGGGGGADDISKTISGLTTSRDHEGFCYTTNSSDTCPSSGTDLLTYCETYGWTVLWRHENHPGSYSCTIGGSECIPNVTSTTMRVAVEAHNVSHNFIGFACSSSFSVDSDNYGKTLTVTWPAPSPDPPSSGGGGGGSASGGTNATSNVTSEKVIVVDKIIETIEPGENKIIPIETGDIKEISITAKNKISNAKIEVKQLENPPVDIKNLSNYVFSYFEINILNFSNDDIDSVSIIFRVNISLVDENNIDKDSITLNRFEEDKWSPLQTSFVSEENSQYVYETLSDGFSLFAISGKEKLGFSSILEKIKKIISIPVLIIIVILIIIGIVIALFFKFKRKNYIGDLE